jgi:hypothetical protein
MKELKFLILLLLLNFSDSILACSCNGTWTTETAYKNSKNVIYGKVLDTSLVSLAQTMDSEKLINFFTNNPHIIAGKYDLIFSRLIIRTEILSIKVYKGLETKDTIVVYTPRQGASCGYQWFSEGSTHVIFDSGPDFIYQFAGINSEYKKPNTYWTNNCTYTSVAYEGMLKELDELSKGDE